MSEKKNFQLSKTWNYHFSNFSIVRMHISWQEIRKQKIYVVLLHTIFYQYNFAQKNRTFTKNFFWEKFRESNATVLLKLLTSWFDEILFGKRECLVFPHCALTTVGLVINWFHVKMGRRGTCAFLSLFSRKNKDKIKNQENALPYHDLLANIPWKCVYINWFNEKNCVGLFVLSTICHNVFMEIPSHIVLANISWNQRFS